MGVIVEEPDYKPEKKTAEEASQLLKDKKNIIILTGAGLSAASGIPTFRGNGGLWTKKYKFWDKPEDMATKKFFREHPEIKWEWTHDFKEICNKAEPNDGHKAILGFQEYCKVQGIQCHLITQNIDDLHSRLIKKSKILNSSDFSEEAKTQASISENDTGKDSIKYGLTNHVYEVHGNLNYQRCFDDCSMDLKPVCPPNKE